MLTKELFSICTFYAISPIHAGSGAATSTVDLPIQRERHTNWPHIQASGVKGAMRDHFRKFVKDENKYLTNFIFGIDRDNDGDVVNKEGKIIKDKDDEKLSSLAGALSIFGSHRVSDFIFLYVSPPLPMTMPGFWDSITTLPSSGSK